MSNKLYALSQMVDSAETSWEAKPPNHNISVNLWKSLHQSTTSSLRNYPKLHLRAFVHGSWNGNQTKQIPLAWFCLCPSEWRCKKLKNWIKVIGFKVSFSTEVMWKSQSLEVWKSHRSPGNWPLFPFTKRPNAHPVVGPCCTLLDPLQSPRQEQFSSRLLWRAT